MSLGIELLRQQSQIQQIIAQVKRDNPASFAAFKKAGFVVRAEAEMRGVQACELRYVRPFGDQSRMG